MKNYKISIIIPVYNAENTLERCIQRIIEQSYSNWELLLIDDGSADNSRKICEDACLKDKRIIAIHKENGGVSSARNAGIEKASGEWITFPELPLIDPDIIYAAEAFWFDVEAYFGAFSEAKVAFITKTLGLTVDDWYVAFLIATPDNQQLLIDALEEYKANPDNEPLIDENTGEWITFPPVA